MGRASADVSGRRLTGDERIYLLACLELAGEPAFEDDVECRRAWERHRVELVEQQAARLPGRRPWAWWTFDAGRPEHLEPYPEREPDESPEQYAQRFDEWHAEPVRFLAAGGHLLRREAVELIAAGERARARIGTDAQQGTLIARGVWVGADRTVAVIAAAVEECV